MAIDNTRLEFKWASRFFPCATITGGPDGWDLSVSVFAQSTLNADGSETVTHQRHVTVLAQFHGLNFGEFTFTTIANETAQIEQTLRNHDYLDTAISKGIEQLQELLNASRDVLGMVAN